jgi:hypothetical protein
MLKKQKFILIAIFILIMFFATAAVCNLCGIGTGSEENVGSSSESIEDGIESTTSGNQNGDIAEIDGDNAEELENHNPVIIIIIADGEELDLNDELRTLINTGITFQVTAQDQDDDTMSYFVSDSSGNNMETEKLDNNNATFGWVAPDEPGLAEIYIRVSDVKGGEDDATVRVTVNILAEAFEDEEEPDISISEIGPFEPMCGIVSATEVLRTADPWIYAGDRFTNEQLKCFLSFDISPLLGLPDIEVVNATLDLGSLTHINDPTFAERLDIKAYGYDELGPEDFAVGGTALTSCSTSLHEFSFSNEALISTLQQAINEDKNYYQLKLGLSSASDEDGVNDVIRISYSEVMLSVSYIAD